MVFVLFGRGSRYNACTTKIVYGTTFIIIIRLDGLDRSIDHTRNMYAYKAIYIMHERMRKHIKMVCAYINCISTKHNNTNNILLLSF